MNPKFFELPADRQTRIINGAMAVFGRHEYLKAGTEEIAQSCGISKGLLYHYFDSKKQLYLQLYEQGLHLVMQSSEDSIASGERDFFKILHVSIESKLRTLQKYPALFDFMARAYEELDSDVRPELNALNYALQENGSHSMFENLDTSKFRKKLDLNKALEMTGWLSEGFLKKHAKAKGMPIQEVLDEFSEYTDIIRKAFYKEDYR